MISKFIELAIATIILLAINPTLGEVFAQTSFGKPSLNLVWGLLEFLANSNLDILILWVVFASSMLKK